MDAEERRSLFKALQAAYARGLEVKSYLQHLQSAQPLTPAEAQQRIDAYQAWFLQTAVLLNDHERGHFEFAYTGEPLKPRLQHYLAHYADERAAESLPKDKQFARMYRWQHPYSTYSRYMDEQISIVATARKRIMDGPSLVPKELIDCLGKPFMGRKHSLFIVDGLFTDAGADPAWCVYPPRRGLANSQKVTRIWSWIDGIRLYAPDRELSIITTVCQRLIHGNFVGAADGKTMERLLASVTADLPQAPLPIDVVDPQRLTDLRAIAADNPAFDLRKLIRLLEELVLCMDQRALFAAAMLTRAIIDHVPPIFACKTFNEVVNNYPGSRSFKDSMGILNNSVRKIADSHLHTHIRASEVLPTRVQVDSARELDVLLSEIIRILQR
ncbi:hypothetical protein [Herpetosiphon geysericola]|uniref:hypothetical protein n=1 Tax=Herpetosiphon geysericola TaxID=70996 RepID=UPI0006C91FE7|nr:hypothetical protein [Herpetosiphon geysericola]